MVPAADAVAAQAFHSNRSRASAKQGKRKRGMSRSHFLSAGSAHLIDKLLKCGRVRVNGPITIEIGMQGEVA